MTPKRPSVPSDRKAGPLFGAGLLGGAVGFMLYKTTGKLWLACLVAITITVLDYTLIMGINKWRARRADKASGKP